MKKQVLISCIFCFIICLTACDQESTEEQVKAIKTVSERVDDLNKNKEEIKSFEEKAALVREESYYLEYEYPIREDESYVVAYRFDAEGCFEIGVDTYLNKESYARKVKKAILKDLETNTSFGTPTEDNEFYQWCNKDNSVTIELDYRNIERGNISLSIFAN